MHFHEGRLCFYISEGLQGSNSIICLGLCEKAVENVWKVGR